MKKTEALTALPSRPWVDLCAWGFGLC